MKIKAQLNRLRIAPRKVRMVADLIRNQKAETALQLLDNTVKRSSLPLKKLVLSAIANAENNFKLNKDDLYITEILVGEGPTLKRWMPRAYGRATKILKRTSNIVLVLEVVTNKSNSKNKKEKKGLLMRSATSLSKGKKGKRKKEIIKDEEKELNNLLEGSQIIDKKIKSSQKEPVKEEKKTHKNIVNPRNASRETGRTHKIFKKIKDKK